MGNPHLPNALLETSREGLFCKKETAALLRPKQLASCLSLSTIKSAPQMMAQLLAPRNRDKSWITWPGWWVGAGEWVVPEL